MRDAAAYFGKGPWSWKGPVLSLLILICFCLAMPGQYYGLQFRGHEYPLDQRTGLDLSPRGPIHIKGPADLEFYVRFDPDHQSYFGYIFRMMIGDLNMDLVHGIVPENPNNFELIIGDRTSKIAFHVPIDSLTRNWLHLRFHIDLDNEEVTAYVQDLTIRDDLGSVGDGNGIRLMFGAHSIGHFSSTDVPSMYIRDVKLRVKEKLTLHWALNETEGTVAHVLPSGNNGTVVHPSWLLKQHNTWRKILDLESRSIMKATYDSRSEMLYFVNADSVFMYDVVHDSMWSIHHQVPPDFGRYREVIYDTITDKLMMYSIDNNLLLTFAQETGEWSGSVSGSEPLTRFWHHNNHIAPDGTLLVFGGYGYHTYKNSVYSWNQADMRFDSVNFSGTFHPRYLAGSGINPSDGKLYLVGGYGSESGKQSESPDYYYEVLSYSLEDQTFSKVMEFENPEAGFCFSNSVVIDHDNNIYGLYYPKYEFNNQLQLVRIPLDQPELIEVGDPIDYRFMDVNSYADLFYSRTLNTLLALSEYSTEERSTLSLYSIAFPPQENTQASEIQKTNGFRVVLYVFIGIGSLVFLAFILLRRGSPKREKPAMQGALSYEKVNKPRRNSILLFGGFQVFDRDGNDITGNFTPLPKKLFLYILLYSLRNEKGVSSQSLYETFWFDKSVESARNNRAVNIVKLKSLLEQLDSTNISKDKGYWKFNFDPAQVYIDYFDYLQILNRSKEPLKCDIVRLLSIVEKSPFLNNTDAEWLDTFKSEVSNEIIDAFLKYISHSADDAEFLLHLTDCIFVFDTVSEEALKLQCRLLIRQGKHSLAKNAYNRFIKEYRQLYDEEYGLSFSQVIGEPSE